MSKFVGTGPSYYKKNNLPCRGPTKVEKHYIKLSLSEYDEVLQTQKFDVCHPMLRVTI